MLAKLGNDKKRGFWRFFDRWALLAVIALQGVLLLFRGGGSERGVEEAPAEAGPVYSAARLGDKVTAANPVSYGYASGGARSPASAPGHGAGACARRLSALDVSEHSGEYELRLSVPASGAEGAKAYVLGRRVDIEVPLFDFMGNREGRLYRQVLLPVAPARTPPRLEHTNGVLRIFVAKP